MSEEMRELPIRVLHVLGKRPVGGVGTFLLNMHRNIDTSQVQFDYLMNAPTPKGEFDRKVKELGGKVFVLPELNYQNTIKYIKELNIFFKNYHSNYDIIHIHSVNIGIFNFILAKMYGIKHRIVHSHSIKYSDKAINSIRNYFLQLPIKKLANIYFACSTQAAIFLFGKERVKNKKVYIAKNAIPSEIFRFNPQIREKTREAIGVEGKFVIGHVGSFLPVKNHSFIIEIFNEIYKTNKEVVLLLVGTGELQAKIKAKVRELNLEENVIFLGKRNDVNELMQAFDIFILPSVFEGLPLVGIEAQASGLPCIFSDTITKEVKITDEVIFKSIKKSPQVWASEICHYIGGSLRSDTVDFVIKSGYEVNYASEKLQKVYLSLK